MVLSALYFTVQVNLRNRYLLKHLAPGSEDYKVEQVHFHWGQLHNTHNGSEHLREGKAYPLEVGIRYIYLKLIS